ncbi:KHDC4/BBP-like KH-domain type I domain-containing protein [Caenorhabditis elegans]|uniref:KHDC4/BBP-like KH-domain type I domain-containing protein n=1 Tax=Caenorhabditis elegans TaxID=6239 RepID=Q20763_CAEEL|nr:KH domain-containing protein [Caenorhabditis elegans]CAB00859.1 KH domain-containing protein [Caenorhabditis elegans]|eukprot:NP_502114.1 Uncharacterized protein CELE_F54D1.1 [Caenorhabditis elegans]
MLSTSASLYLNELINEMRQLSETPIDCKNARMLLSKEISKVFDELYRHGQGFIDNGYGSDYNKNDFYSPHSANSGYSASPFPSRPSLPNHALSTSFYHNSFMTPIRNGRMRSPDQDLGDWSREKINDTQHVLQTKVYIPEPPVSIDGKKVKCNYIGRILGPSGMSARMIENQYDVTLLIRGAGSVRNKAMDERVRKRNEHLEEPLHVLLIARHNDKTKCEEILNKAAEKIESLLTPIHDEYKMDQLVSYAKMNGTYQERPKRKSQLDEQSHSNYWAPH